MKTIVNFCVKLFSLGTVFCIFSCDLLENMMGTGFHFDETTFIAEWNNWENENITDYRFTLQGELPYWNFSRAIPLRKYTVNIRVKNGGMDSFEYIGEVPRADLDGTILEPEFTSISDMYQKIYARAQDEKQWWETHSGDGGILSTAFTVTYNTTSHYITFFEPVSQWKSGWIVDTTDHAAAISDFEIVDTK